jgi:hypothetical protein
MWQTIRPYLISLSIALNLSFSGDVDRPRGTG